MFYKQQPNKRSNTMTFSEIMNQVKLSTAPNLMAPEEALKYMQEIIMALEEECDALEESMEDFK
jgi:hypothetical protein